MSELNKALEATRVLARQFQAFATVAKTLEEIVSLEDAAASAKTLAQSLAAEAAKDRATLDQIRVEIFDAKAQLEGIAATASEIKADAETAKSEADAYVKRAVEEANAKADEKIKLAEADAESVRKASEAAVAAVDAELAQKRAELEQVNAAIAEARAKLGL